MAIKRLGKLESSLHEPFGVLTAKRDPFPTIALRTLLPKLILPGMFTTALLAVVVVAIFQVAGGIAESAEVLASDSRVGIDAVPGAPTNVVASAGDAQANVSWDAPASDGGSAITFYTVTSSPGGATATTTATTTAVTGLTNGTSYSFTVTPSNADGTSTSSAVSNSITPVAPLPPAIQQAKLLASDGTNNDEFGTAVAISGDTVVIGAPEDDDAGNSSGSAYVYVRNGGVWTQQQKLTASDAVFNDRFGNSVGISGDTIVVGAWLDDSMSGSAYVFIRSGGVWTQQQKIRALDAGAGDLFGSSVSISGDRIVVGAPGNDDVGIDSGSAYIFVRSAGVWAQAAKLTAGDASSKDNFGTAVAIDGTTAVVSAIEAAPPTIPGAAYVFVLDQGGWIQ